MSSEQPSGQPPLNSCALGRCAITHCFLPPPVEPACRSGPWQKRENGILGDRRIGSESSLSECLCAVCVLVSESIGSGWCDVQADMCVWNACGVRRLELWSEQPRCGLGRTPQREAREATKSKENAKNWHLDEKHIHRHKNQKVIFNYADMGISVLIVACASIFLHSKENIDRSNISNTIHNAHNLLNAQL